VILPDGQPTLVGPPRTGGALRLLAKRTGHKVGLDAATRMAKDADFSPDQESRDRQPRTHSAPLRPLDELKRILSRKRGRIATKRSGMMFSRSPSGSDHQVTAAGHRMSRFRGLPQSSTAPTRNCLDFG
jgi:hypothetical protein